MQIGYVHVQGALQGDLPAVLEVLRRRRGLVDGGVFEFVPLVFVGRFFADPFEPFGTLGQHGPFGEDWLGVWPRDGEAPVYQMSGEFRLRVLVCVLAVEVVCSYEGAFLCPTSAFAADDWINVAVLPLRGGCTTHPVKWQWFRTLHCRADTGGDSKAPLKI